MNSCRMQRKKMRGAQWQQRKKLILLLETYIKNGLNKNNSRQNIEA